MVAPTVNSDFVLFLYNTSCMDLKLIKAIFYLVGIIISLVLLLIYNYCQKRQRRLDGNAQHHSGLDPDLCAYIKRNGQQCQHEPKNGSRYCALHSRKVLMERIAKAPRKKIYDLDGYS